jgi:hypothetical protein
MKTIDSNWAVEMKKKKKIDAVVYVRAHWHNNF